MWIYRNKDWPNFTWNQESLAQSLITVRHKQGRLLGRMEGLGFDLKQEASLNTLTTDVLTTSAIEGKTLNPEEVRSSIARRLGLDIGGMISASRDVEGIVEMMLDATQNFQKTLTAERLFDWHATLFPTGRSGMHKITVGAWRPEEAGSMQVISGPMGREKIHFEAPPAVKLDQDMKQFLSWLENNRKIDPVLKAGVAHLWFVTIHPFEDGNGRIARAIADMMLARADGIKDRFYSMSAQIEAECKEYYRQLECRQRSDIDITPWLLWFLGSLEHAISGADKTLAAVLYKAEFWHFLSTRPINERQRLILNKMLEDFKGHMNTSKYAKLVKCSNDTALRDIRDLVDRGVFIQNPGGGRSTSYRLAKAEELK